MTTRERSTGQSAHLAERLTLRFSNFSDVALPSMPAVPGLVSEAECRYLYWLTSRGYTGAGAVVEVGTWLGLSTLHLACGLGTAGYSEALHCFDQFVWRGDHTSKATLPLRRGDDFQPYFERNIRPEILFLDAPTSSISAGRSPLWARSWYPGSASW